MGIAADQLDDRYDAAQAIYDQANRVKEVINAARTVVDQDEFQDSSECSDLERELFALQDLCGGFSAKSARWTIKSPDTEEARLRWLYRIEAAVSEVGSAAFTAMQCIDKVRGESEVTDETVAASDVDGELSRLEQIARWFSASGQMGEFPKMARRSATKSDDFRQRLIEQIDALNQLTEAARQAQVTATEAVDEEGGNDRSAQLREQFQRELDALFAAFSRVDAAAKSIELEALSAKSVGAHGVYR